MNATLVLAAIVWITWMIIVFATGKGILTAAMCNLAIAALIAWLK